ncbi:MAG TPA: hypothetical protein DEA08_26005, partial [Planctomycetes bacterium]|nr:hypothetical protein [Planctomycetota bacterium]
CPPPVAAAAERPFLEALERYAQDPGAGYEALVAAGQDGGWSCAGRTWSEWFELLDSPRGGRSAGAAAALQRAARDDEVCPAVAALVAARLSTPLPAGALRARAVTLGLGRIVTPLPPQLGPALEPYLLHGDDDLSEGALNLLEQLRDEDHDLHLPIARILAREIEGVRVISTLTALELLGRSERGVAALDEVRAEGRAALDFPWAICAFRATGDPLALARLREAFADASFCGGRQGWLVESAFQVVASDPVAVQTAAPDLVSLVERQDRHHLAARALQLLTGLGQGLAPWVDRLRAAVERVEEEELRADLLELLGQFEAGE